ncbi:DUF5946 family protein [Micromonospora sp. NPDC049101]|uniref:DUF5946 family protein n=1 Tax=unclassified Micromonospora TaxID=2617518 RepID=UPI0033EBB9B1
MNATHTDRCAECGGALPASGDCWTRLHELLEIETRVLPTLEPQVGMRAHFFAVATYQLQHPSRLTRATLDRLHAAVDEMTGPAAPPLARLRRDMGRFAAGSRKVTRSAPPTDRSHIDRRWPVSWSVTAHDVTEGQESEYPDAVGRWAVATLADLRAALAATPRYGG